MRAAVRFLPALISMPFGIVDLSSQEMDRSPWLETRNKIVHVEGDHAVIKNVDHVKVDGGKAWYVVNTSRWLELPQFVRESGIIAGHVPGKFALVLLDPSSAERLAAELHATGMACGLLTRLGDATVEMKTIATPVPVKPVESELEVVRKLAGAVDAERIKTTINEMSAITTRYYSTPDGVGVSDWLVGKYRELASGREDIEIAKYDHAAMSSRQASVVVRIRGTRSPDEILVLGSHIDSVNWSDGTRERSPGVDDNASGTATNLEIFRVLMANGARFERTVEIHGYAAEEIGLVGSLHIANDYKAAGKRVVAMMQQDMNLYKQPGQPDKIWFVEENTNAGFNDQLAKLVDSYVKVAWEKGSLTSGSSDHASWTRRGYPAAFPFEHPEEYNPHIHTADDTTVNANAFSQSASFGKLGIAYLAHFAGIN
ncbi:MAG: hypothetical protein RIQ81_2226 [Pseudomonadota bacterium]